MHVYLIDDRPSAVLPFTFLRASWDVALGGITTREWVERQFPEASIVFHRGPFQELDVSHFPALVLNGRLLPSDELAQTLMRIVKERVPVEIRQGDDIICAWQGDDNAADKKQPSRAEYVGKHTPLMRGPWDIVGALMTTLPHAAALRAQGLTEVRPGVFAGSRVQLPSTLVTKTEHGPIVIGEDTEFGEFIVLRGPLIIGAKCKIRDAAVIAESAIGDVCKIGGEVEKCVFDTYSNKQHYGYFGHTIVGSWVNAGAGSTTSDLKHTYGTIRVDRGFGKEETGLQFCGAFIGEGSRISINASIMSGTVMGLNVFVFGMVRGYIPSFSSSTRHGFTEIPLEVAWLSRARAMERRNIIPAPHDHDAFAAIYERTGVEREKRNVHHGLPVI